MSYIYLKEIHRKRLINIFFIFYSFLLYWKSKPHRILRLAAIDIGSNAIRFQVTNVISYQGNITFKKLEYVRFPLRLGNDVFSSKSISKANEAKFFKLMHAFKLLIDLYEVDNYMVCATSAMREAKNGEEIAARVKKELDLKIRIIDGNKEAEMINRAISSYIDEKTYLHIDVGGGSTELNLYYNREKINSRSFKIGSVRRLGHHDSPVIWKNMQQWIGTNVKKEYGPITAIGTGGNINKIFELAKTKTNKALSLAKVEQIKAYLSGFTYEERINVLQLNTDRADVILPASEIYIAVMHAAKVKNIIVPDVGLKDGMMQMLYEKSIKKKAKS